MNTFNELYQNFKAYYIFNNGQAKFNKVQDKVLNASRIIALKEESRQKRISPTRTDIASRLNEMPYFIFSSRETSAMAEFIALKNWDDFVNSTYFLANEREMFFKGDTILRMNHINIPVNKS